MLLRYNSNVPYYNPNGPISNLLFKHSLFQTSYFRTLNLLFPYSKPLS